MNKIHGLVLAVFFASMLLIQLRPTPSAAQAPPSFSTYIGGAAEDTARDAATDSAGNIYVCGGTASSNFPVTFGPAFGGTHDIWIAKLSPSGTLLWCRYLGGPNYDRAYALEVDATGIYLAGRAGAGFPVTAGALQTVFAGDNNPDPLYGMEDGFAAKLDLNGTLLWATYVGGIGPEVVRDVAIDSSGNVYCAMADCRTGFQHITAGAFDTTHNGGGGDGALVKISANGSTLIYGTFIGGSGIDGGTPSVRVNAAGEAYMLQGTNSTNVPTTAGCFQPVKSTGYDLHLAKFNTTGSGLIYATYFGGNSVDFSETHGLALYGDQAVIAITTQSTNLLTTPGALRSTFQGLGGSGTGQNTNYAGDAFVAQFNLTGSALVSATYLGGSVGEGAEGVTVDATGNIFVSGATYSTNFPSTPGSFRDVKSGSADLFGVKLSNDLTTLLYGTFAGGTVIDYGRSSTIDSSGNFILVGHSQSTNFPLLNAFQTTNHGGDDAVVTKITPVVIPPSGGTLNVTFATPAPTVNLATDGPIDWTHWGLTSATSLNRKSGVTAQISNFTKIGTAAVAQAMAGPTNYTWTGGTPTASATTPKGSYVRGVGNGFQITLPADTTLRSAKFYVGLYVAQGKFEATLSDGSASPYIDTSLDSTDTATTVLRVYTISYQAASAGKQLILKWTEIAVHNSFDSVRIQAASMQ